MRHEDDGGDWDTLTSLVHYLGVVIVKSDEQGP